MRIFIVLGLIGLAFAQEIDKDKLLTEGDPREVIENVKIFMLTKKLDITKEQASQLFPTINELQKIDQEFREKRLEALHEMKRLINSNASEQEINNVIREYEDAYNKKIENEKKRFSELKKILTPIQQAKYLIFQEEFEGEIRNIINEIKNRRSQK